MGPAGEIVADPQIADCVLVIMAKAPRSGSVKTRLAQSLSLPSATELYRCLLDDTIDLALALHDVEVAIMCPADDAEDLSTAVDKTVRVVPQRGDGLAAGLTSVFTHFAGAGPRRIIAFNSDTPHLSASVLRTAFEALATHDVVVGPTTDGGYYLVGASVSHAGLFTDDGLGTKSALDARLARAEAMGLSVELTDPFYDIDEAADLVRLATELPHTPGIAPRTAAWLVEWRRALGENRSSIGAP